MDLNLLVTGSAAAWTFRGVADGRVVPETVVLLTFPWEVYGGPVAVEMLELKR